MIRKKWQIVIFVFFIASVIAITSDFKNRGLLDNVRKLFKSPIKGYKKFDDQDKTASNSVALAEQKIKFQFEKPVQLEGSLVPVGEHLDKSLPSFFRGRKDVENYYFDCSCTPDGGITDCITSCSSVSTLCGQRCTNSRIFSAVEFFVDPDMLTSTSLVTNNCDCEKLVVICSASEAISSASAAVSSVLASAVVFGAVAAVALGVGIGVPAIAGAHEPVQYHEEYEYTEQYVNQEIGTVLEEPHFPDDGCGSNSVQLKNNRINFTSSINTYSAQLNDGACALLLHKGPCVSPFQWVTLDVQTLQGQCGPRLCGRERVFVGRDELCHDINDPSECQGGRRLYYSAFGDSICDCPIGQYPFPTENGDCVALFTQGPCPAGNVVTFSGADDNRLVCSPSLCPSLNSPGGQPFQMVPFGNTGQCYALGTRGPCPASHLLGYDVFKLDAVCVNIKDPSSPYFSTPEEDGTIDRFYNQSVFNDVQPLPFQQNSLRKNGRVVRRQRQGAYGQLPSRFPDILLNPCRSSGDRKGLNYKCTNPLVPRLDVVQDVKRPIRSPYRCLPNTFLRATGQCSNDIRGASCGPSYRYNPTTGKCRPIFNTERRAIM